MSQKRTSLYHPELTSSTTRSKTSMWNWTDEISKKKHDSIVQYVM